jgi:hypothetical protein
MVGKFISENLSYIFVYGSTKAPEKSNQSLSPQNEISSMKKVEIS